jgi:hypothetical protein
MLPDGSGIELSRRLREWTRCPSLVLSAVGEEDAKVEALEAGADDYVTKPFGPRELVARLGAALRRGRRPGEPRSTSTACTSTSTRWSVSRDGEESSHPIEVRSAAGAGAPPGTPHDPPQPARGGLGPAVLRRRHAGPARPHRQPAAQIEPPASGATSARIRRGLSVRLLGRRSSQDLYELIALLDSAFRRRGDDESMDLIAIALALGVFALLVLLIEGIERV